MSTIWGRVMRAAEAAWMTFNESNLVPTDQATWDSLAGRQARYDLYSAYENNTVYSAITSSSAAHKLSRNLYKHIRSIYNPVAREVALIAGYVYGGNINTQTLENGAIPLTFDNKALLEAIPTLFKWSRWQAQKTLFPRNGALYGDSFIKIVDEPDKGRVRLEILHPSKVAKAEYDSVGNIVSIDIVYQKEDPERKGRIVTYKEHINKEKWQTFRQNMPYAYHWDVDGKPISEWDNEYGFVPVVHTQHQDIGKSFGANAFYNCTPKIDEINDSASLINDQIRKTVQALFAVSGVQNGQKVEFQKDENNRDQVPLIRLPVGGEINPVIAPLPIEAAIANLDKMLVELEKDLPELALQRIRENGGDYTAPGIRTIYSDAITRVEEMRGNYDDGQVRAIQMAVSIGGYRRYQGFEAFDLDSYDAGDMELEVKERPVIPDTIGTTDRISALQTASGLPEPYARLVLEEMGYDQQTIEDTLKQMRELEGGNEQPEDVEQPVNPADTEIDPVQQLASVYDELLQEDEQQPVPEGATGA